MVRAPARTRHDSAISPPHAAAVFQYPGVMASILDRVQKLLALAASPNAHEARNAAYLAAKLIREHGLELKEPAGAPRKTTPSARKTPPAHARKSTPGGRKTPGSKRGVHVVEGAPAPIRSPLGGDCFVCGRRYPAGADILWSDAEGGMHPACFDVWVRKASKR